MLRDVMKGHAHMRTHTYLFAHIRTSTHNMGVKDEAARGRTHERMRKVHTAKDEKQPL